MFGALYDRPAFGKNVVKLLKPAGCGGRCLPGPVMTIRINKTLLAAFIFWPAFANAQSADEIIERFRSATSSAVEKSQGSIVLKGELCAGELCFPSTLYLKFPRRFRLEMEVLNQSFLMIGNDSLRWEHNPLGKSKLERLSPSNNSRGGPGNFLDFMGGRLTRYKELGIKVELLGKVQLDSVETFQIRAIGDSSTVTYYLNTKNSLVNRIIRGDKVSDFRNYFTENGNLFPRLIIERSENQLMIFRFDSVAFDRPLEDDLFHIPDSVLNKTKNADYEDIKTLVDNGNYDEAIGRYNTVIRKEGGSRTLYNLRGLAHLRKGDYYTAIADFTRALEYQNDDPALYHNRGLAKFYLGDFTNSMKDYDAALALDTNLAVTYKERGVLFYRQSKYEQALEDFNRAIHLNPQGATLYFNRGATLAGLSRYEEAVRDYRECEALGYADPDLFNFRGVSHYRLKEYDTAAVYFKRAIAADAKNVRYRENLSRTHYALGAYEEAENLFLEILQDNPEKHDIANMIGLCRFAIEDYQGAVQYFTRAIEIDSAIALYFNNRASARALLEDYQGAIADYDKSISLHPNNPEVFFERGMLKIRTSKKIEGCMDLGTANEMKFEKAHEAILANCH